MRTLAKASFSLPADIHVWNDVHASETLHVSSRMYHVECRTALSAKACESWFAQNAVCASKNASCTSVAERARRKKHPLEQILDRF